MDIKMPDLATTEGTPLVIGKWLVAVGDKVTRGQPILEVETDKAVTEVEAYTNGTVAEILANQGDEVAVGDIIARLK